MSHGEGCVRDDEPTGRCSGGEKGFASVRYSPLMGVGRTVGGNATRASWRRMPPVIIAFAGQAGAGKDTLADAVQRLVPSAVRYAFASSVKHLVRDYFDTTLPAIEVWKNRGDVPPGFAVPMRRALQIVGDGFREIDPSVWARRTVRIMREEKLTVAIVTDLRYTNEMAELQQLQRETSAKLLTVFVARPDQSRDDHAPSERQFARLTEAFAPRSRRRPPTLRWCGRRTRISRRWPRCWTKCSARALRPKRSCSTCSCTTRRSNRPSAVPPPTGSRTRCVSAGKSHRIVRLRLGERGNHQSEWIVCPSAEHSRSTRAGPRQTVRSSTSKGVSCWSLMLESHVGG